MLKQQEIRISLTLRQPLLEKYFSWKRGRELRCGGKLSHNVIIADLLAKALEPSNPVVELKRR